MILILRGKQLGFSLSAIKEYLDLYDINLTQHAQLRVLLAGVAKRHGQLLASRQAIDDALAELADITARSEVTLKIPAPRARLAVRG
jgi:DNA-binding transcriptional MerR regulator